MLDTHPDTKLFVVGMLAINGTIRTPSCLWCSIPIRHQAGEYGRQYFMRHNIPIERSFLYTAQNPTMQRAREITAVLLERFESGELQKIYVIYTDIKNSLAENVHSARMLPFHRSVFTAPAGEKKVQDPFEFYPSVTGVLDNIVHSYVSGYIYSALIDSFCCEQNARMSAMSTANENAEKMLSSLGLEYNRIRQAAITQEITEVAAGARAQRLRKAANTKKRGDTP